MANISTASGVATITGTIEELEAFKYLNENVMDTFDFGMKFETVDMYKDQLEMIKELPVKRTPDVTFSITTQCYGNGRWAMNASIEKFFDYLINHIEYNFSNKEIDKSLYEKQKDLFLTIYNSEFEIHVNYTDSESGQGFIYQGVVTVSPKYTSFSKAKKKNNLYNDLTKVDILEEEDIDYNAENLAKYQIEEHPYSFANVPVRGYLALINDTIDEINKETQNNDGATTQTWFNETIEEFSKEFGVNFTDQEIAKYLEENKDKAIASLVEFKNNPGYIILFTEDADHELKEPLVKFLQDVAVNVEKK